VRRNSEKPFYPACALDTPHSAEPHRRLTRGTLAEWGARKAAARWSTSIPRASRAQPLLRYEIVPATSESSMSWNRLSLPSRRALR